MIFRKIPKLVSGETNFKISVKYLRYFSQLIFEFPYSLMKYKSVFKNANGSQRVVGGTHITFKDIQSHNSSSNQVKSCYVQRKYQLF